MTSDETQQTVSTETVGQQLKKARERHGLSISQIADAQHLRIVVIQAIENGDYGQIGSELFLKGYARAYAKQVGLNGDTIIADLNKELEPARLQKARELEANPLVDIERRRRRKQRIGKLLLLIAAAVLIGGFVVMFVVPKFSSGEVGASLSTMSAPGKQSSEAGSTATSDMVQGLNSDQPDPQTETAAAPETGVAGSVLPDDIVQDQIPVVAQSTEPALAQSLVSEDAASLSGRLEIDFTGDCWVQVQDATGNSLASALKRAGDKLEVSGPPPLKVVIGAVDTVKAIRFQGEPVDIADFPVVNNRSEFTLTI
jgi:cytoskeleton protein RodZ